MKKNLIKVVFSICLIALSFFAYSQSGGVSINNANTPAHPSAILDVSSTSSPYMGMLIPRMNTANRNSIAAPATGLHIFNTDCGVTEYYTGTCWIAMGQVLKTPDHITCSGTTDFCAGETRTFTIPAVTGATTYDWTVPAGATVSSGQGTTSATVVFGNNSGQVCVSAINLCESSVGKCMDIHINPVPPTPGNITGPTTVVPSTSATYFIAAVTGAGVYNWTVPAGATITSGIGTTTITVNYSCSAVSGNITVTAQSNCGTSSANALAITVSSVSANAGPSISGHGAVGGSPTASGGTSPYTYAWLPSVNLSSATVANPTTTACTTTAYTVTVTDANGCTSNSSITVNNPIPQPPVASVNPNPICAGYALNLSTSAVPGAAYSWTGPAGFNSTDQNPSTSNIQTNQSGDYTVTATVSGCSATSSTNVVVYALPASSFTYTSAIPNTPVTFTPTVSGATYSWTFDSGSIASSTNENPIVTWNSEGYYNVSLTVTQNGCSSTTTSSINIHTPVIVTFTNTGTTSWTPPSGVSSVEVLVVAGGGSGGGAGGGGGGGVIYNPSYSVGPGSVTITVGAGGATQTSNAIGNNGENSVFGSIVAIGGGGGGAYSGGNGASGGSGGGGGSCGVIPPGSGTNGQGYSGGTGGSGCNPFTSGGGGGAGGAGGNASGSTRSGDGGIGIQNNIDGNNYYYGGGGGGGAQRANAGNGGLGGGGGGAELFDSLTAGTGGGSARNSGGNGQQTNSYPPCDGGQGGANTGGGGGGMGISVSNGGAGGSGIVIIVY